MGALGFRPEGFRAYFPNLLFSLIRSGKARRPDEFVFRVPSFVNKFDIHQYVAGLYGLDVDHIHTVNFVGRESRLRRTSYPERKTAIVRVKQRLGEDGKAVPIFKLPPLPRNVPADYPMLQPVRLPTSR